MDQLTSLKETSPIDKLATSPHLFDFFQAVRLLSQEVFYHSSHNSLRKKFSVGYDSDLKQEIVRFKSIAVLKFPISALHNIQLAPRETLEHSELQVSFLGLFGPSGILPNYYTELIIQRLQEKDTALRDFLDLFNHRIISLFYRSWEKHHFFAHYERARQEANIDPFSKTIAALIGNGTAHLQNRTIIADETFYYYAGLFSGFPRSACVLETILADYFSVRIKIEQFQGKWLPISKEDCTRLASIQSSMNAYNQLGCNTLLGQRTWDIQGSFKIKIGPLSYKEFQQFLPSGNHLSFLIALTRRYIGINFNFDVQLILKAEEVPACYLNGKTNLGWNTWLKGKPILRDVADTHLSCLGKKNIFED